MTEPGHKLGEVLRAAREAKGVDLARVERETKIRERYLSALERGEYRELPGAVYTKGFLRNYGAYLGLDPEDLIDLYRLETADLRSERAVTPTPRPLGRRRARAFVVTPGAVVAAILTLLVGGFIAYLGYEFVNFARTPELRIVDPAGNVSRHPSTTLTIRGVTAPNATITVSNLRENPTVEAAEDGTFEVTVELVPGSNVVRLVARDPVTGRDSEPEERTIIVATDTGASPPAGGALSVEAPAPEAAFTGVVPVRGAAPAGASVTVTAALVEGPQPSFTIVDAAGARVEPAFEPPTPPEPLSLATSATGAFAGELRLRAGTWDVTVATGGAEPVVRRVRIGSPDGLRGTLRVVDGESYLEVEADGTPVAGASGAILGDGQAFELEADREIRIRAGNAGVVHLVINGIGIGAMGDDGQVVEWRISRNE